MTEPARIAKLIRLLASSNDAEVLTAARMLKKLTDLNDLGNRVEHGFDSSISDREKQLIRNAAYHEGLVDGIKKGHRNARPHKPFNTEGATKTHFRAGNTPDTSPSDMVQHCVDNRLRMNAKEREFIDSLIFRLETTSYLSEKQRTWLGAIYERLGGI